MNLDHKREIDDFKRVIMLIWLISITSVFLQFLVIGIDNDKQAQTLKQIQVKQLELQSKIEGINPNKEAMDIITISLNHIAQSIDDVKEAAYDVKALEYQTELAALDQIQDKEKWFLEYKDLSERYSEYIGVPVTIYDMYSENEIYLLQRMVETEVGSGDFESKVHVADVVWNRIENDKWPDTIEKIIVPGQFAFGKTMISESTRLAVEYSFMFPDETMGALAFHSMEKSDKFGNYFYLFTDQVGHHFYSEYKER